MVLLNPSHHVPLGLHQRRGPLREKSPGLSPGDEENSDFSSGGSLGLLARGGSTEEILYQKKWYALSTKCHHEKQVSLRLEGKGVETFLPVRRLQRRWKDRKTVVDFPLFPGYLFVNIPLIEKRTVVQTPSVVTIVGTRGPVAIPELQITAIKKFLEEKIEFDPYPYLVPGCEVEVMRGPLKNVRGVLVWKKNKHRLVINVALINNSIATEIDAEDVRRI
jgi:transcription termination/antitermination protein NusG